MSAYDKEYYAYLSYINKLHKRIGLPANYINSTFTFIRRYIRNKITDAGKFEYIDAVEKLIDINLELLSTHYAAEDFDKTLKTIRVIRESIDNNYFQPFAQPLFSTDSLKKTVSYECLCRIKHPEHGIILPWEFLEVSKQIDCYHDITKLMFQKTFERFKGTELFYSLNLSYSDILNNATKKFINDIITEYKPGNKLTIEIVETEELKDNEMLYSFFCDRMRSLDVKIAIDDFGAGFSNFNNINKIAPNYIKIDGSLIKDIDNNPINYAAVESIIMMSRKLGITTVAEYVHSESVKETCEKKLGVDTLQGFLLGEPVDIGTI